MTEENQTPNPESHEAQGASERSNSNPPTNNQQPETPPQQKEEHNAVPYSRFKQVNDTLRNVKGELDQLKSEREQEQTKAEEQRGEYKKLYEKEQKAHQKTKEQFSSLQSSIKRSEQVSTFRKAANGVILPEAMEDAFDVVSREYGTELDDVETDDEETFAKLAQRIAESRPYMANGARGAGSGGSRQPVLGSGQRRQAPMSLQGNGSGRIKLEFPNKSRRRWK